MKVAIYARVSTNHQSHDMQIKDLTDYCTKRNWEYTIYSDTMSGSKDKRPGLDQLMRDARKRRIKKIRS